MVRRGREEVLGGVEVMEIVLRGSLSHYVSRLMILCIHLIMSLVVSINDICHIILTL